MFRAIKHFLHVISFHHPLSQKVHLSGTKVLFSHPPSIWSLSHMMGCSYLLRTCTTNIEKKPVFLFYDLMPFKLHKTVILR